MDYQQIKLMAVCGPLGHTSPEGDRISCKPIAEKFGLGIRFATRNFIHPPNKGEDTQGSTRLKNAHPEMRHDHFPVNHFPVFL
ncbi:hypothetical protein [Novipirellula caenicola]|uniref:Uncharacterized protein n=1 Tax=Novipirellula caenicola TaxID=1536901 RepID=A0ABP9VW45_9BACT